MGVVELVLLAGAVAGGGMVALASVLVARSRRRRNRVVPEVATSAPAAWAGAHTPEARLHRRLRDAVTAARAVPDPAGALIAARVEIERSALAIDEHLVALAGLAERERAGRLPDVAAAVASVEEAVARLSDTAAVGTDGARGAVAEALERTTLLEEARRELERDPADVLDVVRDETRDAAPPRQAVEGTGAGAPGESATGASADAEQDDGGPPRPRPMPG